MIKEILQGNNVAVDCGLTLRESPPVSECGMPLLVRPSTLQQGVRAVPGRCSQTQQSLQGVRKEIRN
jgi:hypothetical protein